jgi:hypothetical protein
MVTDSKQPNTFAGAVNAAIHPTTPLVQGMLFVMELSKSPELSSAKEFYNDSIEAAAQILSALYENKRLELNEHMKIEYDTDITQFSKELILSMFGL